MEFETPPPGPPDLGKLENIPTLYTRLYSTRAFDRWRQLFTEHAVVVRLDESGPSGTLPVDAATERFRRAARQTARLEETWDGVEVRASGNLATIQARYTLATDVDVREGTDLLTLVRVRGQWKIACLAYEQTRRTPVSPAPQRRLTSALTPASVSEPQSPRNLSDPLTEQAKLRPDSIAIRAPDRSWTFLELERLTWRCTALLAEHGVAAGDTVALDFEDEPAALVALLATARRGATVCWIPKSTPSLRAEMAAEARARVLLGDAQATPMAGIPRLEPDLSSPDDGTPPAPELREPAPTAPWTVITGSGSTGKPKKIPIGHPQFLAQGRIYNEALALGPSDVIACLLPLDAVVKRERLLDALLIGATVTLAPRSLADPIGWLRSARVSVLWATVSQVERLLEAPGAGTPNTLPGMRALVVGSSSVSIQLRRRVLSALTPRLRVYYGMNEVGLVCITSPRDLLASAQSVGSPAPEVVVEVVDDRGQPLPAGQIGEVRLRSPGAVNTYLDDVAASQRAFRQGWFHPGDLGRLAPDGRLDFCGRADHMMILDGVNIYPEEIERTLLSLPGIADAAVIPFRHPLYQDIPVCAVAPAPGISLSPERIMRQAREQLGFRGPRAIVVLARIPRNEQGKLIRQELRNQLAARLAASPGAQAPRAGIGAALPKENLTFDLIRHARSTPDAPCLVVRADLTLSYRAVDQAVWRFSQHLHRQGLRAGDVLGLTIADELTLVLTMLAVIRLGATVFSIPRRAPAARKRALAASAGIRALASDLPPPDDPVARRLPVSRALLETPLEAVDPRILCQKPHSPWLLITGSGSTGEPKLIPVTHNQTAARSRLAGDALHITAADRLTSLSHFDFSTSKFRLHECLRAGAAYALNVWSGSDPMDAIRRLRPSVIYATVFHVETLLARLPPDVAPALGDVRILEITASTVSDSLRRRVRQQLCANLRVRYAINEAGAVSMSHPPEVFDVQGTVGKPLPGVQVEIVDARHQPLSPGNTGLIRIRSPGLVDGYHGDEASTRRSFSDGWFTPGDLGRFTPEGELIFCGRADHMMIMNGMNIYPAEIERVVGSHPAVRDVAAMPVSHPVHQDVPICAVALYDGGSATASELLAWAREQLGAQAPHHVFVLDEIPRNHEGKLVRQELADRVARRRASLQSPPTFD